MAFYAVHLKCGCLRGLTHAPNPDDLTREYYCTDHSWQPVTPSNKPTPSNINS